MYVADNNSLSIHLVVSRLRDTKEYRNSVLWQVGEVVKVKSAGR